MPRYVTETFHLTLGKTSAPILAIYAASAVGSIGGGYISGSLLKRGKSVNVARKTAMAICAVAVIPVLYAPYSHDLWTMVAVVGLAAAAHQGWSANAFTLTSDLFPRSAVGSVVGIGGMAGAIGGVLMQLAAGQIAKYTYLPMFVFCGSAYLIALLAVHLLTPKMRPAALD
jgi:ACS family hexuronate transporter-like MFS transporter